MKYEHDPKQMNAMDFLALAIALMVIGAIVAKLFTW